jgi:hypothetical protein
METEDVFFYIIDVDWFRLADIPFRDSFRAAANSFDAILDAFFDSLRRFTASAHFLCSTLYFSLAHGEW